MWSNKLDFLSFTSDDVHVKLSVTNQLSKRCNMHFETLFSGHLKLTLRTHCQNIESNVYVRPIIKI